MNGVSSTVMTLIESSDRWMDYAVGWRNRGDGEAADRCEDRAAQRYARAEALMDADIDAAEEE